MPLCMLLCKEYLTLIKKCRLLFSAVISQHFSKNRMIISVVAAKVWYLKKCTVFIGPPCIMKPSSNTVCVTALPCKMQHVVISC